MNLLPVNAARVSNGVASVPTPVPTGPAFVRPYPSATAISRVRHPRLHKHGERPAAPFNSDIDQIAVFHAQLTCRRRREGGIVVPHDLGHRVRDFLEPSVVRKASVPDKRTLRQQQRVSGRRFERFDGGSGIRSEFSPCRGGLRHSNNAVMQRAVPERGKIHLRAGTGKQLGLPFLLQIVEIGRFVEGIPAAIQCSSTASVCRVAYSGATTGCCSE